MSFILDAIRKSEDERQRSKQPDVYSLQNAGARGAQPAPAWARALLLLLAIALVALLLGWLWPQLSAQFKNSLANSGAAGSAKPQATQAAGQGQAPTGQVPAAQAGAPVAVAAPVPEANDVMQSAGSAGERVFASDDQLPPRHLVKELWELPADYQSTIPDLKFSFHVFSPNPDKRTIVINGRRLREGQMITSQMRLRVITETGVICHHRGRFFHVDVVEKW